MNESMRTTDELLTSVNGKTPQCTGVFCGGSLNVSMITRTMTSGHGKTPQSAGVLCGGESKCVHDHTRTV